MGNKIGVWMDSDKAYVIENDSIKTIESDVEHFNLHGGAKGKNAFSSQDATSESKLTERKKHQLQDFFKEVMSAIDKADQFVVFGPAETKTAFKATIESNNTLKGKLAAVESADSMTENQLKEWVRNYFAD